MNINNISEYLAQHGVRPSYQRTEIYKYIINNKSHPTAEMIFKKLAPAIPTLSKTTVYNTLKLFTDKNLVRILTIEENEKRYDAVSVVHGHFKCEVCGGIYDFDIDLSNIDEKIPDHFSIKNYQINLSGICNNH